MSNRINGRMVHVGIGSTSHEVEIDRVNDKIFWTDRPVGKTGSIALSDIICVDTRSEDHGYHQVFFLQREEDGKPSEVCALKAKPKAFELPKSYNFDHKAHSKSETHVIVSVKSGKEEAKPFFKKIIEPLMISIGMSNNYKLHETTSSNSIIEFAKDTLLPAANEGRAQHVVLLSGDGGVVDIINDVFPTSGDLSPSYKAPVISLIPMGTGNALANSSNINDFTLGLASWLRGKPRDLPLLRITFPTTSKTRSGDPKILLNEGTEKHSLRCKDDGGFHMWAAVVFSWGFHAQIVADSDTPGFRQHGVERFKMAAQEALSPADGSGPHRYLGTVSGNTVSGKSFEYTGPHSYVLGTLVSSLEQGFTISPRSGPMEGRLHLVHIKHTSAEEVMRIMGLAYQGGKHVEDGEVEYEEVSRFTIKFEEEEEKWRRVCVDGKIVLVEKGGEVIVEKEELIVLQLNTLVETA